MVGARILSSSRVDVRKWLGTPCRRTSFQAISSRSLFVANTARSSGVSFLKRVVAELRQIRLFP